MQPRVSHSVGSVVVCLVLPGQFLRRFVVLRAYILFDPGIGVRATRTCRGTFCWLGLTRFFGRCRRLRYPLGGGSRWLGADCVFGFGLRGVFGFGCTVFNVCDGGGGARGLDY